jgi:formamidopyrimidine-DNA glycosylase
MCSAFVEEERVYGDWALSCILVLSSLPRPAFPSLLPSLLCHWEMVEGPQVKLKNQRILTGIAGQTLQSIQQSPSASQTSIKQVNMKVSRVDCVGKELFIVMEGNTIAIRLHFGMNGTETIQAKDLSAPSNAKSRKVCTAILTFEHKTMYLFDTQLSIKYDFSWEYVHDKQLRDIMHETFNLENVLILLLTDSRPIEEVILDQDIMPGVGNVIKCEGLFRVGVHPQAVSSHLSADILIKLIQELKCFAWEWYEARRRYKDIKKQVYGLDRCSKCSGTVSLVRMARSHRITYYCQRCQPTHFNITNSNMVSNTGTSNTTTEMSLLTKRSYDDSLASDSSTQTSTANISVATNAPTTGIPCLQQPKCACSLPSLLQRVRKEGPNRHRLFWSCSNGNNRNKKKPSCKFFYWADAQFPRCSNHCASATILRRVLKPGNNNGRYFYCCSVSDCKFFQWADVVSTSSVASTPSSFTGFQIPL